MPSELVGHKSQLDLILGAVNIGKLHHAWLLEGTRGIGKYKFAEHMAHHLLEKNPEFSRKIDDKNPVWQRMNSGGHCDFMTVKPEAGKQLNVDKIREIDPFLHKTTAEGGWRIVIVDDADKMNKAAANALLKGLEEPTDNTVFFLVVSDSSALPKTIFSRCQKLSFRSLPHEDMNKVMELEGMKAHPEVLAMANGSPGVLSKINDNLEVIHQLVKSIKDLPIQSVAALKPVIEAGGADDELFELIVSIIFNRLHLETENSEKPDAISIDKLGQIWKDFANLYKDYKQIQLDRLTILMYMFSALERKAL